ncbi:sensor histidine kinase [Pseudoprimorskyibacter insulae]|uniref:histidine kinase n=1 Tax=Pseudoprimorskyibacter insulae TaxID=1695997 RepID=A0A2R8AU53_9RHOB|nr:sensor histidine kinase [Pseudoprimorskyibacter insulae]SPF79565.1 putative sensor histidine kinase pdtaS [Pseudoprimorskyibacter insulae]
MALLPLGLLSVNQNMLLLDEANRKLETTLLAQTAEAAGEESALFRTALGVVEAVSAVLPRLVETSDGCEAFLGEILTLSPALTFVGYTNRDGIVECGSAGNGVDVSSNPFVINMAADPARRVSVIKDAPISKVPTVVVAIPVFQGDTYDGLVSVSIRHGHFFNRDNLLPSQMDDEGFDVLTFNSEGEILTGNADLAHLVEILPQGKSLEYLTKFGRMAFTETTVDGEARIYAAVPIIDGTVYALGTRAKEDAFAWFGVGGIVNSLLFPVAMWLCSLGVAFFAVQRMVIRPMRNLRARMLMFTRNRSILEPQDLPMRPVELVEMDETWERIATSVLRDEAELHNVIHEKTVLLKEVHHRVKNNLQLIASILNMKMRKADSDESRSALTDIQNRVMSIARVHQKLYETSTEERVRVDELLQSIVSQFMETAGRDQNDVRIEHDLDPIVLYPDQAVPMSLAASELLSNALKYLRPDPVHGLWIKVSLKRMQGAGAELTISNSLGGAQQARPEPGSGLGRKLIAAFAQQMEGHLEEVFEPGACRVSITFQISGFHDEEA